MMADFFLKLAKLQLNTLDPAKSALYAFNFKKFIWLTLAKIYITNLYEVDKTAILCYTVLFSSSPQKANPLTHYSYKRDYMKNITRLVLVMTMIGLVTFAQPAKAEQISEETGFGGGFSIGVSSDEPGIMTPVNTISITEVIQVEPYVAPVEETKPIATQPTVVKKVAAKAATKAVAKTTTKSAKKIVKQIVVKKVAVK